MESPKLSSAEKVTGGTDTLWEILLRMPPKSLLRFKCVSKEWLSLINDPRFCELHCLHHGRHHHGSSSLLLRHMSAPTSRFIVIPLARPNKGRVLNLDFLNRRGVSVVRSCNGLLLCYAGPNSYLVCNPTTKRFVSLSLPVSNKMQLRSSKQTRAVHLDFDPSVSLNFRVISIRTSVRGFLYSLGQSQCVCDVYSSETRSWSHPPSCFTAPNQVFTGPGVFFNNAIHWCQFGECSEHFDVGTGCLKNLSIPLCDEERGNKRLVQYFGVSGGRLCLVLVNKNLMLDVCELEEDISLWLLKHRVDINPALVEFPELSWDLGRYMILCCVDCQAKQESSMLVFLISGTAICYNPVCCTWRKLCVFSPPMTLLDAIASHMCGEVFQYFDSLYLV